MSATMIAFPTATTTPRGPLRFTTAQRRAIMAAGYVPGLEASFGACDDGDEWAAIGAASDEFSQLDAVGIAVTPEGFNVFTGTADLGTFASIHQAVAAARRDMVERMEAFDPLADLEAWRGLLDGLGSKHGSQNRGV